MSVSNIPFLDLVTPHKELEQELVEAFRKALHTAGFIGGPAVEGFENEFAAYCDSKFCVGVANGTDALRFALIAAGIQAGDAVITVPNTFIATTEAISQAGARPYFVDIDERTYNMDPAKLREFLEKKCTRNSGKFVTKDGLTVKAVLPVHLYGQMADMDAIMEIAEEFGLLVVEDACQAHGAEYFSRKRQAWVKPGAFGVAAAYSFYPGKNLGACGEAGAVTTNNEEITRKIRMIRDHGQAKKYYHDVEGYNGRLDAIQAALLSVKLKHLSEWTAKRCQAAALYNDLLAKSGAAVISPYEPSWSRAVYHLYVIRCVERDALRDALAKEGIGTGIHYPIPLHLQEAYVSLGYKEGDFPVAEISAKQAVSLPMSTTLTLQQQTIVVQSMAAWVGPVLTT